MNCLSPTDPANPINLLSKCDVINTYDLLNDAIKYCSQQVDINQIDGRTENGIG